MSSAIFNTLIRAAARGEIRAVQLNKHVQQNTLIAFGMTKAKFVKHDRGAYEVFLYKEGETTRQFSVATPAEAKDIVLEHIIEAAKEEMKEDEHEHA